MTVSLPPHKNKWHKNIREYLFIFSDSESLTLGILFLYHLHFNFKSMLYKTDKDYRLIIKSNHKKACFISLNEFCTATSCNCFETAYTKEYGKLLIEKNAIKTFGKYFSKEF